MEGLKLERRFSSCSHGFKQFHFSVVKGAVRRDKNFVRRPNNQVNPFVCAQQVFKIFDWIIVVRIERKLVGSNLSYSFLHLLHKSLLSHWPIFFRAQLSRECKIK
jgi:hypothetical protein